MAGSRSYVAGNFLFNLNGVKCGFVRSVEGGDITAEVIEEPRKGTAFVKKHIGQPKYEDITLTVGFDLDESLYEWIAASWKMNYARKDGSITAVDATMQAKSEREFFHALITEIGFPALDGSSKEPAYLTVKFSPEYTRIAKASGKVAAVKPAAQKQFLPSNFRLELDGLDCTKVSKIDSFTVKQTPQKDDIGDLRDMQKEPGKVEFPNLRVELAEVTAATWHEWHEDFVVKGNNDDAHEKSGTIVFLTPNRQEELARINLFNVGIFALRRRPATAATEKVARVVAELYCERMELQVGKPLPR
jgi:phage tail-like protein